MLTLERIKSFDQDKIKLLREQVVGIDKKVPTLEGIKPYVNFDNAASTPTLKPVLDKLNEFLEWYSSIHRGSGFKSLLSSEAYEKARLRIGEFFKADLKKNTVIFGKNTTEALNKLAYRFPFRKDSVVLSSMMEHHSNDLPWRKKANVIHIRITPDGRLDLNDLEEKLKRYKGRIDLVAIAGASNVTGFLNPIHQIAKMVHQVGAKLVVDAAQLAPHRPIDLKPDSDPEHIDFLAFSAHKIYAPFGTGVLIGSKSFFEEGDPELVGGGTIEIVTLDMVMWAEPPDKEEAGSPNVVGAVALAEAIKFLNELGMDNLAYHEKNLCEYLLKKLPEIKGLSLYGDSSKDCEDRLGVFAFNFKGMHHALVSAILSYEGGIGVRHGCFCAHPYVKALLGIGPEETEKYISQIKNNNRAKLPGAVRVSFGFYNNYEEIDYLIEWLKKISAGKYKGEYILDKTWGTYTPRGFKPDFERYFSL